MASAASASQLAHRASPRGGWRHHHARWRGGVIMAAGISAAHQHRRRRRGCGGGVISAARRGGSSSHHRLSALISWRSIIGAAYLGWRLALKLNIIAHHRSSRGIALIIGVASAHLGLIIGGGSSSAHRGGIAAA